MDTVGHRSYRVATPRQCLRRSNVISIGLRRVYQRLSYLQGRAGLGARMEGLTPMRSI